MTLNLDFETFSLAGTHFDLTSRKFKTANKDSDAKKKGLFLVGAYRYAAHHSTIVLVVDWSFDEGQTMHQWKPGDPPPKELLDYISRGGNLTAWNSFFEWCIWNLVCVPKYGWPSLPIGQTRCSMARGYAWSLPGALDKASAVMYGESEKDTEGKRIMLKLSQPRNPTANDPRMQYDRSAPKDQKEATEWERLDSYCAQDVRAEVNIAKLLPPLSPFELAVWQLDQRINARGVCIDLPLVESCLKIMKVAKTEGGLEMARLTSGVITAVSQATAILEWVNAQNPSSYLKSLELPILQEYLDTGVNLPPLVVRVLEIRKEVGGNAPSKLVAMKYQVAEDNRVRGAFQYCGAQRTRRWAGRAVQTHNMPKGGPEVVKCGVCGYIGYIGHMGVLECPACGDSGRMGPMEWGIEGVNIMLPALSTGVFNVVHVHWGNPAKVVSGCLRSLLIAAPGMDLISSDFSAIEAVVMACMAGEPWIIDVFNADGKLYERTGAKTAGVSIEEVLQYKIDTGNHHPARATGKVQALAYQFQGARGAALKFGAGKFMTNKEIDKSVKDWREAAPNIVAYWYAVESSAISAVSNPGGRYPVYRQDGTETGVTFQKVDRALYCILPGGGYLTYVDPAIEPHKKMSSEGYKIIEACEIIAEGSGDPFLHQKLQTLCAPSLALHRRLHNNAYKITPAIRSALQDVFFKWVDSLTYYGVGSQRGRVKMETYGGKLAENITQAVARDIQAYAMLAVEAAGYPIVLHTHDEIVSEIPEGSGSVEDFERIMSIMPNWAANWPIKAAGGWRGKRYRK